jgi:hypothetical protein
MNAQKSEFPDALNRLVEKCTYRDGWNIDLIENYDRGQGSIGLTLIITTNTVNSYNHDRPMYVNHLFIVPARSR